MPDIPAVFDFVGDAGGERMPDIPAVFDFVGDAGGGI